MVLLKAGKPKKVQHSFMPIKPRQQGQKRVSLAAFMLFLMMSLVSSGNAVSFETSSHLHNQNFSMSEMAMKPVPSDLSQHEADAPHCQHQGMLMREIAKEQKLDASLEGATMAQNADMSCCNDECQCPTDHCYNFSATALLQPLMEAEVTLNRTAALSFVSQQYTTLHFG